MNLNLSFSGQIALNIFCHILSFIGVLQEAHCVKWLIASFYSIDLCQFVVVFFVCFLLSPAVLIASSIFFFFSLPLAIHLLAPCKGFRPHNTKQFSIAAY